MWNVIVMKFSENMQNLDSRQMFVQSYFIYFLRANLWITRYIFLEMLNWYEMCKIVLKWVRLFSVEVLQQNPHSECQKMQHKYKKINQKGIYIVKPSNHWTFYSNCCNNKIFIDDLGNVIFNELYCEK